MAEDESTRRGPDEGEGGERDRLLAAFAKAATERGYRHLTLEQVSRYSGLDQARFEAVFGTKEQGLIAAQDVFLQRLLGEVDGACAAESRWSDGVAAGLHSAIASLVEASTLARVFIVEATGESFVAAEHQYAAFEHFAALLRTGRSHHPRAASLPVMYERVLIGGVASIAAKHLLSEDPGALAAAEQELTQSLLIPYLGEDEAARVAAG
jgi:AcrR family transcriptional regulator